MELSKNIHDSATIHPMLNINTVMLNIHNRSVHNTRDVTYSNTFKKMSQSTRDNFD